MSFSAVEEVAMVLPISVTPGSGEQAVRFINFEDYPDFFGFLSFIPRPNSITNSTVRRALL